MENKKGRSGGNHLTTEGKNRIISARQRHGGYSWLYRGSMPQRMAHIQKYLDRTRSDLIGEFGMEESGKKYLLPSQDILLNLLLMKLGFVLLVNEWAYQNDPLLTEHGILKLQPALGQNLTSFMNGIRLDLLGLKEAGLNKEETNFDFAAEVQKV